MNLVADESVDRPIAEALRASGHQVIEIADLAPSLSDEAVLRIADEQLALLLTQDRDFGELVFRLGRASHGVLLVRLHGMPSVEKASHVSAALQRYGGRLSMRFAVLSRQGLRVRGLPEA